MVLSIILLIGLVSFIEALFDKFNVWRKFELWSISAPSKLMHELLNCRFCLRFWFSFLIYCLLWLFSYANGVNLAVLFASNGLIYLIQKK